MPSNKGPKQTKKSADEVVTPIQEATPVVSEVIAPSRTKKSSTAKKTEMAKTAPVKRHRKATPVAVIESTPSPSPAKKSEVLKVAPSEPTTQEKPSDYEPAAPESLKQDTLEKAPETLEEAATPHEVSIEEISELAYSYWVERGYQEGSAEEDWLRAEHELKGGK